MLATLGININICNFQIRMACKLLEEETIPRSESPLFEFVESCIRHKSETVVYEAAHAIVHLSGTGARHLAPAVSVLQLFCSSAKPTLRFAAVRTLNKVRKILNFLTYKLNIYILYYI